MMWQTTPRGPDPPREIHVIVETPRGSRNKYELAKGFPGILLDRVLLGSLAYPCDYGLVPQSWGQDGDPLDALVIATHPTFPGCVVRARPIGALQVTDRGQPDEKILCAPVGDPRLTQVQSAADLGQALLDEIADFFRTYKRLELDPRVEVHAWRDTTAAHRLLDASFKRYDEKFGRTPEDSW